MFSSINTTALVCAMWAPMIPETLLLAIVQIAIEMYTRKYILFRR